MKIPWRIPLPSPTLCLMAAPFARAVSEEQCATVDAKLD